jgi:hypothetical protein
MAALALSALGAGAAQAQRMTLTSARHQGRRHHRQ